MKGDPFASLLCFRDGDMEALSLAELPLRAELVIMSACIPGSARCPCPACRSCQATICSGLQAALFQAGVRSVIGTLWTLDDTSALAILPELHRHLAAGIVAGRGFAAGCLRLPAHC